MARRSRKNVGVIGLGIIGSRVADNLRRQGYHVFVWNRNPRPVPNFVGAPAELAEMCDYIQIFVSDDDALLDVVRQMAPALVPRHIVIAHPTVAPHSMRTAADLVERRGARFVEAPFTGSKMGAEKRSEEHTSELQSQSNLVCRLLLEKKKAHDQTSPACER